MKKVLLVVALMLIASFNLSAAERIIHSYLYHGFKVYDRENNLIQDMPSSSGDPIGLFLVAEIDGKNIYRSQWEMNRHTNSELHCRRMLMSMMVPVPMCMPEV